MPAISVIMPIYNSTEYLHEAIQSILRQTFTNFEFIIINDGSTDNSAEVICSYDDDRIVFLNYKDNKGYTERLNQGITISNGKYIARMDADDISDPKRFQIQFDYLEKHVNVGMCGTFIQTIGNTDLYENWVKETDADRLKINLLFSAGFCHPTVMIRKETLTQNSLFYDKSFEPAEDYWLWTRLSKVTSVVNLDIPLLQYRISEMQVSVKRNEQQKGKKEQIIKSQLNELNLYPSLIEINLHLLLSNNKFLIAPDYFRKIKRWNKKLKKANNELKIYNRQKFQAYLDKISAENFLSFKNEFEKLSVWKKAIFYIKKIIGWRSISESSFSNSLTINK
jgi:glycosyltransferase involved in cell wall biosynthesis